MSSSQLNASLLRLKLLDALRSGDTSKVDSVINSLQATKSTVQTKGIIEIKETILHYAVQVAPLSIIQYLVLNSSKLNIDINSQDQDGNTPLHLAAASSRGEIVKYLLSLNNINDTTLNKDKKQPVELCKDLEIAQLMQFERAKFVEKSASLLRDYFTKRDLPKLEDLLVSNPRSAELLDINGSDPETGYTVLHEFILKNDLQMCDWILKHGGDPFKRDKKGKLPIDLIHNKTDPIRKLLKVASKEQTMMDPVEPSNSKTGNAPTYKGYLKKWTNFASGYKLRYFVLDDKGILSYYANQDDTNNAVRGSLNLGFATLHLDSSEKLKFEIIGKNGIRWHLRANHPIETNRWVWTLQNAITMAKDRYKKRSPLQAQVITSSPSVKSEAPSIEVTDDESPTSPIINRPSSESTREHKRHLLGLGRRKHKRTGSQISLGSVSNDEDSVISNPPSRSNTVKETSPKNLEEIKENQQLKPITTNFNTMGVIHSQVNDQQSIENGTATDNENFDYDLDDLQGGEEDSDNDSVTRSSNNTDIQDQISTVKGSLEVEIKSLLDLFSNISNSPESLDTEIFVVGKSTLGSIQDLFVKYNLLIQSKDFKNQKILERQLEVNKLWENSIHQLEKEIASREQKLAQYEGKQKKLKKIFAAKTSGNTTPKSGSNTNLNQTNEIEQSNELNMERTLPDTVIEDILNDSEDEFFDADSMDDTDELLNDDTTHDNLVLNEEIDPLEGKAEEPETVESSDTKSNAVSEKTVVGTGAGKSKEDEDQSQDVSKDSPPQYSEISNSGLSNPEQLEKAKLINSQGSFLGYENPPRTKLAMDEDNRPKVGLWGILKSMIGKDMTKMTLPVSFNECTSLLQRLAEDIEYSNLLEQAASFDDSALRTAYVATFAASEYASTIDRIAKPFNPLLGETFEYCRPDKNYRLISEQVSHHPPISACSAESVKWDYYGENAVASQFKGRSFDFKHLGKMFAVVRPDNGVIDKNGKKVYEELYSWKKVNTSVVGIIVGNPTVDNYGKMEVTNHTTGDVIVVDLKQRGWRASSAYQLFGTVVDKSGRETWTIGGHWNSKIFGKKASPKDASDPNRRASFAEASGKSTSTDPFSGGSFLIWQAAPRPKVPFNLTSFAVTLNGLDANLKEFVAPTDTRLRPDQRAMEDGEYDKASDEKWRLEEKQRAARKNRELKKETYKPVWFVKKKHPVTGDSYWEFQGKYWELRKDRKMHECPDIF
ncbi:oxysterol-binding protein homolog 1 [[Candida] jaroonii]|uniref:Oxysterol-binding protein homolog 1 n=1 Tax=[Candida] jaroonii TaxID=467808 RepID=A0ACA9YBD6_9ASCO|nr:oxysterol-binding protein homolog 1 [[Candida] jaroonii]